MAGWKKQSRPSPLAPALPVRFDAVGFQWQGQRYIEPLDAVHLSWPNPLDPW